MGSTKGTGEGGSYSIVGLRVKYWELLPIFMSNVFQMVSVIFRMQSNLLQ